MHDVWIFLLGGAICSLIFGLLTQGWLFPPILDPGHRLYAVKDEHAAAVLIAALAQVGLKPKMAFDAGPTHQVVMNDGQRTVIAWFDEEVGELPQDAPSFWVWNPKRSANRAARSFTKLGYDSQVREFPAGKGQTLFVVTFSGLKSSVLVYRRHWFLMGKPAKRPVPSL